MKRCWVRGTQAGRILLSCGRDRSCLGDRNCRRNGSCRLRCALRHLLLRHLRCLRCHCPAACVIATEITIEITNTHTIPTAEITAQIAEIVEVAEPSTRALERRQQQGLSPGQG